MGAYGGKIRAKLRQNARIEFADTANSGKKIERIVKNFVGIMQNE